MRNPMWVVIILILGLSQPFLNLVKAQDDSLVCRQVNVALNSFPEAQWDEELEILVLADGFQIQIWDFSNLQDAELYNNLDAQLLDTIGTSENLSRANPDELTPTLISGENGGFFVVVNYIGGIAIFHYDENGVRQGLAEYGTGDDEDQNHLAYFNAHLVQEGNTVYGYYMGAGRQKTYFMVTETGLLEAISSDDIPTLVYEREDGEVREINFFNLNYFSRIFIDGAIHRERTLRGSVIFIGHKHDSIIARANDGDMILVCAQ